VDELQEDAHRAQVTPTRAPPPFEERDVAVGA